MLRTIDRYLLRQYLQVFVICYISLTGLYIVIDAFGHLDHFVDHAEDSSQLFQTLGRYYGYRSLAFFDRTSGVLALIAAMFTVTWIQRHQEMTALLAAGVPRLRVLRPILFAAIAISLLAAGLREMVIPNIRHHLATDTHNLSGQAELPLQSRYDNQTDILLGGERIVVQTESIVRPVFVLPPGLDRYGKQISAERADYHRSSGDRPSGYWLRGVNSQLALLKKPSIRMRDGTYVLVTPHDAAWLADDEVFVVSGVSFELLSGGSAWRDYASTPELVRELASPSVELGADVRVAVHRRLLTPFLDVTLVLLGLPLVVSGSNRNPFVAIGLCLAVVTAFFLVALGSQSLGSSGWIRPALAAWTPLLVFVPVATAMSNPLRT